MRIEEIKEDHWDLFCRRFEETHRGTPVTLEVIYHDGATAVIAQEEVLREFKFEKTTNCNDRIRIMVGEQHNVQHQVIDPIHLRVREPEGLQKVLEVDAESGSIEMRFSSGRLRAVLNDIQLMSPQEAGREGGRKVTSGRT